jgi:hypothetical protein
VVGEYCGGSPVCCGAGVCPYGEDAESYDCVHCCRNGACCSVTEATEATCGDGLDNDCDEYVDCDDTNCIGRSCGGSNVCIELSCCAPEPAACASCECGWYWSPECSASYSCGNCPIGWSCDDCHCVEP